MKRRNYNIPEYIYKIAVIVLIITVIVFFVCKYKQYNTEKSDNGLKIDKTENVITEIKRLNQFVTASYYEEMVLHYTKKSTKLLDKSNDEIIAVAKGNVRAGFDFHDMDTDDIIINNDTITISINEPEILDVIINPSGFEIYEQDGKWSQSLINTIHSEAKKKLRNNAVKSGILDKADTNCRRKLTDILHALGFKYVIFTEKQAPKD